MAEITITVPDDCAQGLEGANFDSMRSILPLIRLTLSEAASGIKGMAGYDADLPNDHRGDAVELMEHSDRIAELSRVYGVYAARAAELDETSPIWRY
jgi:hypothetical protein